MSMLSRFATMSAKTLTTEQLEKLVAERAAAARQAQINAVIEVLDDSQKYVRQNVSDAIGWLASAIAPSK